MGAATGSRGVRSSLRNLCPHFPPLRLHSSCTCSVCPRIGLAGGGHRLAPPLKGPVPSLLTPNRSSGNWPPSSLILHLRTPSSLPAGSSCPLSGHRSFHLRWRESLMGKKAGCGRGYTGVVGSFTPVKYLPLWASPVPGDQEEPGKQMGMREGRH